MSFAHRPLRPEFRFPNGLYMYDAFTRRKIAANCPCSVDVSMKHIKLLLLLLRVILNESFVNYR